MTKLKGLLTVILTAMLLFLPTTLVFADTDYGFDDEYSPLEEYIDAYEGYETVEVTGKHITLRILPGTYNKRAGSLRLGDVVEFKEFDVDKSGIVWIRVIIADGDTAWMPAEMGKPSFETATLGGAERPSSAPGTSSGGLRKISPPSSRDTTWIKSDDNTWKEVPVDGRLDPYECYDYCGTYVKVKSGKTANLREGPGLDEPKSSYSVKEGAVMDYIYSETDGRPVAWHYVYYYGNSKGNGAGYYWISSAYSDVY